jgi:hypothetical protein
MRDGALVIIPEPIAAHEFGDKQIPSVFSTSRLREMCQR